MEMFFVSSNARIGFVIAEENSGWMGGKNYLINLMQSVSELADRRIETVLFVPPNIDPVFVSQFPVDQVVHTRMVHRRGIRRILGVVARRLLGRDFTLEWLGRSHCIDRFSHIASAGRFSPVKVMTWIPDFQHIHLPDFFSEQECARRDAAYATAANESFRVILSSHAALADFISIHPDAAARSRVVQFVSNAGGARQSTPLVELAEKYDLCGAYFHVPNQLWKHKNHWVIIEALALLRARGTTVTIVCTGDTLDYRHPEFFEELKAHIAACGVVDSFRILGLVPYADVTGLMRHATAVINPSLFEGWSTAVEEAKSLGKCVLLSDIPVHREQAPPRGIFFRPNDASALADALLQTLHGYDVQNEQQQFEFAQTKLAQRFKDFGKVYQQVCLDQQFCP